MTGRELRLTRLLPASPEEVFDAWTDPAEMREWLCPEGGTVAAVETDPRPGGRFRLVMRLEGREYEHTGVYLEVERPGRLSFTWTSEGTSGRETLVTVELQPRGNGTEMTLIHADLPDPESTERHRGGWSSILDRLQENISPEE